MNPLRLWIPGPVPSQGSGRAIVSKATGRAVWRPSNADVLARFRADLRTALADHPDGGQWALVGGPVGVNILAVLPRPKGHYGTGRNAGAVKPSAPRAPVKPPDADKVARAVLDALVAANMLLDDAQVVALGVRRVWAACTQPTGVQVDVEALP